MKTYEECKTEIARQYGYLTWAGLLEGEDLFRCDTDVKHRRLNTINEGIASIYAKQVAEDVRQRCADNAVCFFAFEDQEPEVSEGSILRTEIILP